MLNPGQVDARTGMESRAAATPALAHRRRDLYLLSGDDSLLLELGPLLGDRYRTRPIESAELLNEAGAVPWLLIVDATARADARAQAARIEQQHPLAPLIVICADGKSVDWASALARGMVSAVVERSALPSGALLDALQAAELRLDAAAAATTGNAAANLAWPGRPATRPRWLWILPALALAGAGAWFALPHRPRAPSAGGTPVAPAVLAPTGNAGGTGNARGAGKAAAGPESAPTPARGVLELLSDARVAFRDQKNLLPRADGTGRGDSALELYAAVLAQDPQNDEARDGLRRLFSVARSRIQSDLAAGRLDEATRLLAAFRGVGLNDDATARLDADIAAARPRWLIAQARTALANGDTQTAAQLITQIEAGGADRATLLELRHTLETRSAEAQLAELAARTRAAISAGTLLEPPADNARTRLAAMQQLNRNLALTATVQHELMNALIARAQAAGHAGQFDVALEYLNAAAEYGSTNDLASARRQVQGEIEAARDRTAVAAPPAREVAQPVTTLAPQSAPAQAEYVAARPTAPLDVLYPQHALDTRQSGYVIIEFLLNTRGGASDLRVVEASPPGIFENAALAAVRRGRFDASALTAGQPRRARLRLTFKP